MKLVTSLFLAGALFLCACAAPPEPVSSPVPQSVSSAPVISSVPVPVAVQDTGQLPALAYLPPGALSAQAQAFWVGTESDEEGVPLQCKIWAEQYGDLGLVAVSPRPEYVYLTFDFGYETGFSGEILDILAENSVPATFFVTLPYAQENSESVRRMIEEGHSLGGHSITHPAGPKGIPGLPQEQAQEEICAVKEYLQAQYGYESRLFRFPEGVFSQRDLDLAAQSGQYSVFWSFAYLGYDRDKQPPVAESLQNMLDSAHPGAIYLLHPQKTNTEVLAGLIEGLQQKGYVLGCL